MEMEKSQIVESTFADLKDISRCHIAAFPTSLSSKMGLAYCIKMLDWYLSTDNKFLFHIKESKSIVGYCGGFVRKGELHGSSTGMTQHASRAGIKALLLRPWLLAHPKFQKNYKFIWRNLVLLFKKHPKALIGSSNIEATKELSAGLVVIGVDPKFQANGYGSLLLKEFEKKAKEMNCLRMNLTVESSNASAIRAYERNGWIKEREKDGHISMIKLVTPQ